MVLFVFTLSFVVFATRKYFPIGEFQKEREDMIYTILAGELATMKRINDAQLPEAKRILKQNIMFIKENAHLIVYRQDEIEALNMLVEDHLKE